MYSLGKPTEIGRMMLYRLEIIDVIAVMLPLYFFCRRLFVEVASQLYWHRRFPSPSKARMLPGTRHLLLLLTAKESRCRCPDDHPPDSCSRSLPPSAVAVFFSFPKFSSISTRFPLIRKNTWMNWCVGTTLLPNFNKVRIFQPFPVVYFQYELVGGDIGQVFFHPILKLNCLLEAIKTIGSNLGSFGDLNLLKIIGECSHMIYVPNSLSITSLLGLTTITFGGMLMYHEEHVISTIHNEKRCLWSFPF
ncbi:unnamed protein product [Lactuca saligna]|uniref:Uncharacterized protein n=1 Tax=Lactuca saligna TaxID=75948 RepID=A0AA36DX79_LACSI|nr:unnamed protein product [Lactuca saligna]